MRIIGGHDYYDSAQAYGHDPKIVFVRSEEYLGDKEFPPRPHGGVGFVHQNKIKNPTYWDKFEKIKTKSGTWSFYTARVIFCGKSYIGIRCDHEPAFIDFKRGGYDKEDTQFFWNKEDFESWVSQFKDTVPIYEPRGWRGIENDIFTARDVSRDVYDWLVENRISIAIYDGMKKQWKINCDGLKEMQFYRVFDAVQAFQQLDMWMSGALGMPGNPMVEISDDMRAQKHGMDKWSFRKKVR